MFESDEAVTTGGIDTLAAVLSRLDEHVDDGERIDQLTALERLKSAVAAAQARVTVEFVASQQQVAEGWREHAKTCSENNDFDGWRQARDNAARASLEEPEVGQNGNGGSGSRSRRRRQLTHGITAQVALARHESPHRGSQHVTLTLTLSQHLPRVMTWLQTGMLSEWRATLIVRECSVLTPDLQEALDAELATTLGDGIGRLGDRQLTRHVKAIAYRLDPTSVLNRASQAEGDRRVSLRPAPDTMAYLTALLPVAQAVAAYAALTHAADTAHAAGDDRGKGQVMADTLVERVTGQQTAEDVNVEVQVVITDDALFTDDDTPAQVPGYGTIPARWVRHLLTPEGSDADDVGGSEDQQPAASADPAADLDPDPETLDEQDDASCGPSGLIDPQTGPSADSKRPAAATLASQDTTATSLGEHAHVWLRRLYTHPVTGQLVGMDSTRRVFDGNLREYLLARDAGTCRTPWCDAPIRHLDHITDHALGGATTATNGQGLCVRCNHTKQNPGFTTHTLEPHHPGAAHTVQLTTPTGHTYPSTAPPLIPGKAPPPATRTGPVIDLQSTPTPLSPFELYLTDLLAS